jgi:hypothetical protein
MEIEFRRTGERRYAVIAHRADQTMLEMNPAPGYGPLMPHDLLHYVVERELGLQSGIFGQLAKGGSAGTFRLVVGSNEGSRETARRRRHLEKRGARLLRDGRRDASESERAVYICWQEWETRRAARQQRIGPSERSKPRETRADRATATGDGLPEECLNRVCARLDDLSGKWARLGIGESIIVEWPVRT